MPSTRSVVEGGVAPEFPEEIGGECDEKHDEGVLVLWTVAPSKINADVAEAGGDGKAIGVDVRGDGEASQDRKTNDRPEGIHTLACGGEHHAPIGEDRGAEVESAAELEGDIAEFEEGVRERFSAERGDRFGHEKVPAETEEAEGEEPEGREQKDGGEAEDG
jgi:hypothetical protein